MSDIAIVRVKGNVRIHVEKLTALTTLKLAKKNQMVVMKDCPALQGNLTKIREIITWGPVKQETLELVEKKANKSGVYMLNSPKRGYGRRGIKSSFRDRGSIGPRGDAINDLIERMI